MDLNQVRYFLNLADSLNFTEAARVSGVSQPSLTKAIQRLEDELGGPVLYRDGKDTRLTALGRDLIVEFMRIQSALESVNELAENSVAGRSRKINIGVASTIAPRVFAKFWAFVLRELPEVELLLHPLNPGASEAEVLSGKYDMCLFPFVDCSCHPVPVFLLYRHRVLCWCLTHCLSLPHSQSAHRWHQ